MSQPPPLHPPTPSHAAAQQQPHPFGNGMPGSASASPRAPLPTPQLRESAAGLRGVDVGLGSLTFVPRHSPLPSTPAYGSGTPVASSGWQPAAPASGAASPMSQYGVPPRHSAPATPMVPYSPYSQQPTPLSRQQQHQYHQFPSPHHSNQVHGAPHQSVPQHHSAPPVRMPSADGNRSARGGEEGSRAQSVASTPFPSAFSAALSSWPQNGSTALVAEVPEPMDASFDPMDPTVGSTCDHVSSHAVPNEMAVAAASPLPMGALISPALHLHPAPPRFTQPVQQCRVCDAPISVYCRVLPARDGAVEQRWACALCQTQQPFRSRINQTMMMPSQQPAEYAYSAQHAAPTIAMPVELACKVVESVWPASAHAAVLPPTVLPASSAAASRPGAAHPRSTGAGLNYAFILDRNMSKAECAALKRSLTTLVRELPPDAGLALVSFQQTVSLYDLTQSGVAACHVVSGATGPTMEDLEAFVQQHGVVWPRVSAVLDHFLDCLESFEQSCSAVEQQKLMNPRAMGAAAEWVTTLVQAGRELDSMNRAAADSAASSSAPSSSPSPPASTPSFCFTHAFLCSSGPPDFGPGETTLDARSLENDASAAFFHGLGNRARSLALQFDYFAQGSGHFAAPIVRKLVDPSGGSVYISKSFSVDSWVADARAVLFRAVGYEGVLHVRYSAGVRITRVIGSVSSISDKKMPTKGTKDGAGVEEGEADSQAEAEVDAAADQNASARVRHLRLQLSHCRPDDCVALYYSLAEDLASDYIYFSYTLDYVDWSHQRVRRTWVRRVRSTGNEATFVGSMDAKVAAVLAVKRIVLAAVHGVREEECRRDVDTLLKAILQHFGTSSKAPSSDSPTAAPRYELPEHLRLLPLLLYHVRRGTLLGPVVQHPDDMDVSRFALLHSSRTDSLRMCQPTLWSFSARTGELEELPLETLTLQSNRILFLDHQGQILIWSGRDVSGPAFDAYRRACLERATAQGRWRLPQAEVLSFNEGSSSSRWLAARLTPSHMDSAPEQVRHFPQLALLAPEQREALQAKLLPTDEQSFVQWMGEMDAQMQREK